jgi:hypothetical protein
MKTTAVVLVLEGDAVEASTVIAQAVTSATMAARDNDAILAACALVPDEAVGIYAASPGEVWEPVRRAIAKARGIPATLAEQRAAEQSEGAPE